MVKEPTRTHVEDNKMLIGELEFSNLMRRLARGYRFYNKNQDPEAIVIPNVKEVDGINIEIEGVKSKLVKVFTKKESDSIGRMERDEGER